LGSRLIVGKGVRKRGAPTAGRPARHLREQREDVYLALEGKGTEPDYFSKIAELVGADGRYALHIVPNSNGFATAETVVREVIRYRGETPSGESPALAWAICDRDDKPRHDASDIPRAAALAEKEGVSFVLCNPCFEVWLYLHFMDRASAFGDQRKAIEGLRRVHPAFADYGKREGDRKRLNDQRIAALFEAGNLQRAGARARRLQERCEREDCDHAVKPGRSCKIEHRDPSSPLHELFTLLGLVRIVAGEARD
jgi:RloB-like protein